MDSKDIVNHMTGFKSARDAAVHADADELTHHLIEFVREVKRNPLCGQVLGALPTFDANAWWQAEANPQRRDRRSASSLDLPPNPDEKLAALWDLVSSMGSGDAKLLDYSGFGRVMGAYKNADAAGKAVSMVIRPFAEMVTERLREAAGMANPGLRELSGVPLAAIPADDEARIFLSHRSSDKPLVRPYFDVFAELGHQPWLDDHDMPAGTTLHRGISAGMDASCAVIFFVTPNFEDERWLAREVDQAIHRKVERGDKFAIITLVFPGGEVPRALQDYVFINVVGEADAIRRILKALPLEFGTPRWKPAIYRK